MNGRMGHRVAIRSAVVVLVLSFIASLTWAQRECCEGESWLRWSPERCDAYVSGYIQGYYGGFIDGCEQGTKHVSGPAEPGVENFPVNKCIDQKWDFTKGIDLSRDITTFYKRYPENRNLLIKEILEELGKGRSLEDIHNHPPFPRLKSSEGSAAKERLSS